MEDPIYRVVRGKAGGFAVEITRCGVLPQTADGFATEAEVTAWITEDKKLSESVDPFRAPPRRSWRGF
ncbi:MAG: hypothetical protein ACREFU_10940 [Acetobacteraceae bacterium]